MHLLVRLLIMILAFLFTPLAFVLSIGQLFEINIMFSLNHIIAFWVMIAIFKFCLSPKVEKAIFINVPPSNKPK